MSYLHFQKNIVEHSPQILASEEKATAILWRKLHQWYKFFGRERVSPLIVLATICAFCFLLQEEKCRIKSRFRYVYITNFAVSKRQKLLWTVQFWKPIVFVFFSKVKYLHSARIDCVRMFIHSGICLSKSPERHSTWVYNCLRTKQTRGWVSMLCWMDACCYMTLKTPHNNACGDKENTVQECVLGIQMLVVCWLGVDEDAVFVTSSEMWSRMAV